jgi:hypothetical protein
MGTTYWISSSSDGIPDVRTGFTEAIAGDSSDGKVSIWGGLLSAIGRDVAPPVMGASSHSEMAFLPSLLDEAALALLGTSPLLPAPSESAWLLGL